MNKLIKNKYNLVLSIIIFLTFFLRIYKLSESPPSLNWDEVSIGYNAYSVLKTGKDEWGKMLPLIFQAYGDYKLPGYIYFSVPFISVFGLNEFSVRLLSVIAGTLSVLFTYLVVQELFNNKLPTTGHRSPFTNHQTLALLSAFLVGVEPWSFFLSRPAFEANLALCMFLAGFYFFLKSTQTTIYYLLSTFLFGLTVWTYNSYRVFTPIFLIALLLIYMKEIKKIFVYKKIVFGSFLIAGLFFIPMFYQLLNNVGQERYKKVAIVDRGAVGQIIDLREEYGLNPLVSRLLFNRPTYFLYNFSKNIISHFSYGFLFSEGGNNFQFSVPGFGVLYKTDMIFLIFGIYFLIRRKDKVSAILIAWLILGTVPSAMTREAPQVLRSITVLPAPMIISAIGVFCIYGWLKRRKMVLVSGFFILIYFMLMFRSVIIYLEDYYGIYRNKYSWSWQYGYKQAVDYLSGVYQNYDKIIFTKKYGEPHEFVLFYSEWDPKAYQNAANLIRFNNSDWFWVDRFDKYYFVNDWDIPKEEWQPFVLESGQENVDCRNIKCLLITSPGNVPKGFRLLDKINFLDGKVAFEIYEN